MAKKAAYPKSSSPAKPTTMLRPRANTAKAQALAAASMSPPLRSISGRNMSAMATRTTITLRRRSAGMRRHIDPVIPPVCAFCPTDWVKFPSSGLARHEATQQAVGPEHENKDEDREDDDIGPACRNELAAQGLDEPDDDAAQHGARNAADAAQNRRREGPEACRVADDVAGEVV